MKKSSITLRVVGATFFSIYLSIFLYSVILPFLFVMPPEERISFWIKMAVVVTILGPICSFIVYLFYRPVARATRLAQSGEEIPHWLRHKAMRSFHAIQGFLFIVGLLAYAAGAGLNFLAEIVIEHKPFVPFYWISRLVLALSFGILNGLVTARMVNLAWLEAKYLMGITSLEDSSEKYESTFYKIFLPGFLLVLFITVFSAVGAIYYIYYMFQTNQTVTLQQAASHFLFIEGFLLVMGAILFATILWENQSHISNLRDQIMRFSEGDMNLAKRVFIISFDNVGMMTAGINKILEKLQKTFLTIKDMQRIVKQSGEITNNIMTKSREEAEEVTHLITEAGENYEAQVDVIKEATSRFKQTMQEVKKAIANFQNQQNVLEHVAQSFQKVASTFKDMISMTLSSTERFEKLSRVIGDGTSGLQDLLEATKGIQETNKKVYEIVKLIMDISDQSNILAMNAAIEASHAGEYGKGFAIVASEVRELAIHTAESARQIESLIHEMQQRNERGATINEKLNEIFKTMQNEMQATTSQIESIAQMARRETSTAEASLKELAQMQEVAQAIKENVSIIETNDASLSEIMSHLNDTAEKLASISQRLMEGISFISQSYANLSEAFDKSFEAIQQLDNAMANFKIDHE
ncbi:Methyl-accepting transducer domain-containing protein [Brevinematales bacterium NS]|nr:Methyl-accepting transducer domain-containing protein [Brevinematales bacterium NS]